MGCTTSAPVDEEAAPKQDLKSKEPPSKLEQPTHRYLIFESCRIFIV